MATFNYENSTYRTDGDLPTVGSRAPDVSLVDTRLHNASLANWMGMRKVINIIVSIDTEVGSKSVIEFDRRAARLTDVAMLSVSYDLPFALRRFQAEHKLEHSVGLSAIRHEGFGQNYGVLIVDGPLAGMFASAVVVLDENNTVVYGEHLVDVATEPNYDNALRALGISSSED